MMYEIKDLIKTYDGRNVLNLKDLSIERGRVLGLLGPNGAGKTTLLEILSFLLPPTSGEVWYENRKVNFTGTGLLELRKKVVLVQQKPILFTYTVFNNVEFPLKIRKTSKKERERTVDKLLEIVGMENFKYAKAHNLSGGETQRIAIAQALACSPEVILMDEPTASVDVENQITIEHVIGEINRDKGISVIFTTHDMIQASRMADEIVFIFEGEVAESAHENIFRGYVESDGAGQKYCLLRNGLKFPVQTQRTGPVHISINPRSILITRDLNHISKENSFKGKLMQLTDEGNFVRALVDLEVPLNVLISREMFVSMRLDLGEDVWLFCPPDGIEIF